MPWVSQVKLYYIWQAEIMLELWSLLRVTSCLFSFSHSLEMCRKAALAQSVSSRLSHTEGHDAREVFYLKYFFPSLYDVRMLSFKKKKKKQVFYLMVWFMEKVWSGNRNPKLIFLLGDPSQVGYWDLHHFATCSTFYAVCASVPWISQASSSQSLSTCLCKHCLQ